MTTAAPVTEPDGIRCWDCDLPLPAGSVAYEAAEGASGDGRPVVVRVCRACHETRTAG